jgi:hypothetical protein
MFLGHFAVALAAKRLDPRPSLATYFAAAQLPDVLWPVFLLAGVEHVTIAPGDTVFTPLRFDSYPYSHSLVAVAAWGAVFGLAYALWRRRALAGVVITALALSHWFLDWITHRPDMPLGLGAGQRYGLGLWNSVAATLVVELAMFAIALALYLGHSPRIRRGRVFAFAGLLLLIYAGNVVGPPPPSAMAVAITVLVGFPLFGWFAWWADRSV